MSEVTLTGRTRFRSLHRGIWPLRSIKLVMQVEVRECTVIEPERRWREGEVHCSVYWRDAKFEDLTVSDKRELFCRENPR